MITKQGSLVLLALLYISLTACKKKVEAAYERALDKGVVLVENDTVEASLKQPLLFTVSFADGVNPIHYTWEIYQQDSQKIRSLDWEEFHFAPEDMVGGPAKGILSFEPLQKGLHKLVFYRPFMMADYYQKDQEQQDPYAIWRQIQQDLVQIDSSNWTRADFETHWLAVQEAEGNTRDSLWKVFYQTTYSQDTLLDSLTQTNLLQAWASQFHAKNTSTPVLELLDSLLGGSAAYTQQAELWHDLRAQKEQAPLPLHPRATTKTYYVRVTE